MADRGRPLRLGDHLTAQLFLAEEQVKTNQVPIVSCVDAALVAGIDEVLR